MPDFRGVLETDDGATVLFSWHGYLRPAAEGPRERYRWLNDRLCVLAGEVRPREDGRGANVVFEISELLWEPLTT